MSEGPGLGIAGAVGQPHHVLARSTTAMTRHMIPPDYESEYSAWIAAGDPVAVLGVTGRRQSHPGTCPTHASPDYNYDDHASSVVIAGRITNADTFCCEVLGPDELLSSGRLHRAILTAYTRSGPEFVARLQGAFALAIWDSQQQRLFLARDRFGVRPLYYYWNPGSPFVFASRVKALLASGLVPPAPSHAGIYSFIVYGVACEPFTAIENVYALPPGYWATVQDGEMSFGCYWDIFAGETLTTSSIERAAAELRPLIEGAVRNSALDDAELCVFLSGGIDSSLLAALARQETGRVNTVSLIVEGTQPSEEPYIDVMQQHLESEHVSFSLRSGDLDGLLDGYFAAMDQPTVDGLNVYAVSRLARQNGFEASLYGIGGDELFGSIWNLDGIRRMERAARLPVGIRKPAGWLLGKTKSLTPAQIAREWLGSAAAPGTAYDFLCRYYFDSELCRLWRGATDADATLGRVQFDNPESYAVLYSRLMLHYYLKNQLLRIADWSGGFHGLEIREPFLDEAVVEWAITLSPEHKSGGYKPVLARAAADLLPDVILNRTKKGFSVPLHFWMQREIRGEVESALRHPPSAISNLLNPVEMRRVWSDFLHTGDRWHRSWGLYTLCRWWESIDSGECCG